MQILPPVQPVARFADLRPKPTPSEAADDFEANFLAIMLKSAGYGAPRTEFGGGIGEEQFSAMLCEEQAKALVAAGGIGLAAQLLASGRFGGATDA